MRWCVAAVGDGGSGNVGVAGQDACCIESVGALVELRPLAAQLLLGGRKRLDDLHALCHRQLVPQTDLRLKRADGLQQRLDQPAF